MLGESDDLCCKFCREGECDPVAFKFGWCGKARLLAAVEGHPLGDSENGPASGRYVACSEYSVVTDAGEADQ